MRVCVGSPGTFSTRKWRVGDARDLREVRDREHLGALGEALQRRGDGVRGHAADARVDLVEDERLAPGDGSERERDARELSARCGLGDRRERQARRSAGSRNATSSAPVAPSSRSRSSTRNSPSPMPSDASSSATASRERLRAAPRARVQRSAATRVHVRLGSCDRLPRRLDRIAAVAQRRPARARPPPRARASSVVRGRGEPALEIGDRAASRSSTPSSAPGSASSDATKRWRSLPSSPSRTARSRSSSAVAPSSGAMRSSGASARSARAASEAAPSPSSGAIGRGRGVRRLCELLDVPETLAPPEQLLLVAGAMPSVASTSACSSASRAATASASRVSSS